MSNQTNDQLAQGRPVDPDTVESYELLADLEYHFRRLISDRLSKAEKQWWKRRIPQDVREAAEEAQSKEERPFPWIEPENLEVIHFVDFTGYRKIIIQKNNWDECFAEVFHDKELISAYLTELERVRVKVAHSRNLQPVEVKTLKLYHEKIVSAIGKASPDIPKPKPSGKTDRAATDELLNEAASHNGNIYRLYVDAIPRGFVRIGNSNYVDDNDPSMSAKYVDALEQLAANGQVEQLSRNLYVLTDSGWKESGQHTAHSHKAVDDFEQSLFEFVLNVLARLHLGEERFGGKDSKQLRAELEAAYVNLENMYRQRPSQVPDDRPWVAALDKAVTSIRSFLDALQVMGQESYNERLGYLKDAQAALEEILEDLKANNQKYDYVQQTVRKLDGALRWLDSVGDSFERYKAEAHDIYRDFYVLGRVMGLADDGRSDKLIGLSETIQRHLWATSNTDFQSLFDSLPSIRQSMEELREDLRGGK